MQTFSLSTGGTGVYLTRADWGARPLTRGAQVAETQFVGLVAHHLPGMGERLDEPDELPASLSEADLAVIRKFMRDLQVVRPDLGSEVPYSWVVLPGPRDIDVVICEGRGAGRTGAHTAGLNSTRYGVGFARNTSDDDLTAGMIAGFRWVGSTFLKVANPRRTQGHQESYATECPGRHAMAVLETHLQPPFDSSPPASIVTPPAPPAGARVGVGDVITAGDSGVGVELFQRRLNGLLAGLGLSQRVPVTGVHDELSVAWCEAFQRFAGVPDDGIVGNLETRPALVKALADVGEPWALAGG